MRSNPVIEKGSYRLSFLVSLNLNLNKRIVHYYFGISAKRFFLLLSKLEDMLFAIDRNSTGISFCE